MANSINEPIRANKKRIGEVLVGAGLINDTQLSAALQSQNTWGGKLCSTLVRMGFVREEDILRVLADQLMLPAVDFNRVKISSRAISVLPIKIAEKYNVMPVAMREDQGKKQLVLAMSDPTNLSTISEIEFQTGCRVRPAVATDSAIVRAIDYYYRSEGIPGAREASVGLSNLDSDEEMVVVARERTLDQTNQPLETLNASTLLKLLVRLLVRKGVITRAELANELRRRKV